jgi:hypothetical protein
MDLPSSLFCITSDLSDADGVCFGPVIYIYYIGQLIYKLGQMKVQSDHQIDQFGQYIGQILI